MIFYNHFRKGVALSYTYQVEGEKKSLRKEHLEKLFVQQKLM